MTQQSAYNGGKTLGQHVYQLQPAFFFVSSLLVLFKLILYPIVTGFAEEDPKLERTLAGHDGDIASWCREAIIMQILSAVTVKGCCVRGSSTATRDDHIVQAAGHGRCAMTYMDKNAFLSHINSEHQIGLATTSITKIWTF